MRDRRRPTGVLPSQRFWWPRDRSLDARRWDHLVVVCGGTSWDGIRFPDQHIAERLSAYAPVLYVDPPISPLTPRRQPHLAASLRGPRLRRIGPSLARLTPVVPPGKERPGMKVLTTALARQALRHAARRLGGDVRAVVVASLDPMFGVCDEATAVLYGTDDFVAGAELMGVPSERLRRHEQRRLDEADLVVACSPALLDKWAARGVNPVFVPNGVDEALFARTDEVPPADDIGLRPPIAGFVGHLSDRIDLRYLEAVAERGHSLLLVGPRQPTFALQRVTDLLARPNVEWTGPRPFADLPRYLARMDVGLVPYADSEFNRGSFPLKTLEYLAGGRAAVTTDLPSFRWLETDLVTITGDPDAFADAVSAALRAPRTPEIVERRRAFAAEHGWSRRAAQFAGILGLADPDSSA